MSWARTPLLQEESHHLTRETSWHRYVYTLFSTVCRVAFGAVTSIIVPKTLGPAAVGTIAFGQIIAQNIRGVFDVNISQSFFTLSSKTLRSGSITRLFMRIIFAQFILTVTACIVIGVTRIGGQILQGTPLHLLLVLLLLEWATSSVTISNQLGDSKGISRWPQIATLAANLLTTVMVVVLAGLNRLTLWSYVLTLLGASLLNVVAVISYLLHTRYDLVWADSGREHVRSSLRTIAKISVPLTIAGYYAMAIDFCERFLIQFQYGASEQAYYQIAARWASLIILFSTASLQVFWQRLVENIAAGNLGSARSLYLRLDGLLFYFTLCLAIVWSSIGKDVVTLLLGVDFQGAGAILTVMAFYPVSQVFGQLGNTIAIASGRTKESSVIGVITSTVGLAVSYAILAPRTGVVPGLGWGGVGLAIKTALFGLVMVQPLTFVNCKYLSISYSRLIASKLRIFMILTAIAAALYVTGTMWGHHVPTLVEPSVRAILFVIAATTLLVQRARVCGIDPDDLVRITGGVRSLFVRGRRGPEVPLR